MYDKEVKAYTQFVETRLKPDQAQVVQSLDSTSRQIKQFEWLQAKASELALSCIENPSEPLKIPIDLGYGYSADLEVFEKEFVLVEVGFGFYCQMTWKEAAAFCPQRTAFLQKRTETLKKQLQAISKHLEMTQKVIEQLSGLPK